MVFKRTGGAQRQERLDSDKGKNREFYLFPSTVRLLGGWFGFYPEKPEKSPFSGVMRAFWRKYMLCQC